MSKYLSNSLPDFEICMTPYANFKIVSDSQYIYTMWKIALSANVFLKRGRRRSPTIYLSVQHIT